MRCAHPRRRQFLHVSDRPGAAHVLFRLRRGDPPDQPGVGCQFHFLQQVVDARTLDPVIRELFAERVVNEVVVNDVEHAGAAVGVDDVAHDPGYLILLHPHRRPQPCQVVHHFVGVGDVDRNGFRGQRQGAGGAAGERIVEHLDLRVVGRCTHPGERPECPGLLHFRAEQRRHHRTHFFRRLRRCQPPCRCGGNLVPHPPPDLVRVRHLRDPCRELLPDIRVRHHVPRGA